MMFIDVDFCNRMAQLKMYFYLHFQENKYLRIGEH